MSQILNFSDEKKPKEDFSKTILHENEFLEIPEIPRQLQSKI